MPVLWHGSFGETVTEAEKTRREGIGALAQAAYLQATRDFVPYDDILISLKDARSLSMSGRHHQSAGILECVLSYLDNIERLDQQHGTTHARSWYSDDDNWPTDLRASTEASLTETVAKISDPSQRCQWTGSPPRYCGPDIVESDEKIKLFVERNTFSHGPYTDSNRLNAAFYSFERAPVRQSLFKYIDEAPSQEDKAERLAQILDGLDKTHSAQAAAKFCNDLGERLKKHLLQAKTVTDAREFIKNNAKAYAKVKSFFNPHLADAKDKPPTEKTEAYRLTNRLGGYIGPEQIQELLPSLLAHPEPEEALSTCLELFEGKKLRNCLKDIDKLQANKKLSKPNDDTSSANLKPSRGTLGMLKVLPAMFDCLLSLVAKIKDPAKRYAAAKRCLDNVPAMQAYIKSASVSTHEPRRRHGNHVDNSLSHYQPAKGFRLNLVKHMAKVLTHVFSDPETVRVQYQYLVEEMTHRYDSNNRASPRKYRVMTKKLLRHLWHNVKEIANDTRLNDGRKIPTDPQTIRDYWISVVQELAGHTYHNKDEKKYSSALVDAATLAETNIIIGQKTGRKPIWPTRKSSIAWETQIKLGQYFPRHPRGFQPRYWAAYMMGKLVGYSK